MAKKFLKTFEILSNKAVVDLNVAILTLESYEKGDIELDLEVVFFHLQQCSEKLIKSLLDINKIKFPHTHDLENLINLLEKNNIKSFDNINDLIPLSEYAVDGRYAVLHDDMEDSNKYIKILKDFIKIIKNIIEEKK